MTTKLQVMMMMMIMIMIIIIIIIIINVFVISVLEDDAIEIRVCWVRVSENSIADGGGSYQHLEGSKWHILGSSGPRLVLYDCLTLGIVNIYQSTRRNIPKYMNIEWCVDGLWKSARHSLLPVSKNPLYCNRVNLNGYICRNCVSILWFCGSIMGVTARRKSDWFEL